MLVAGSTAASIGLLAVALWVPGSYARPEPDGRWFFIVGDSVFNGDELDNLAGASGVLGALVFALAAWRVHPIVRVALGLVGFLAGLTMVQWIATHLHGFHDGTV